MKLFRLIPLFDLQAALVYEQAQAEQDYFQVIQNIFQGAFYNEE
jgi:hypothetical protein